MELFVVLLLYFHCLIFSGGVDANECEPKGYGRNALHVCNEGSTSGRIVAIDASKFNGFYCECILTHSGVTSTDFNVEVDYIIANINSNRISFSVDDKTYGGHTVSSNLHTSKGDSIYVLAEKRTKTHNLRVDGNPCLAFKTPELGDQSNLLNLTCFNGTQTRPDLNGNETSDAVIDEVTLSSPMTQATQPSTRQPTLTTSLTTHSTTTEASTTAITTDVTGPDNAPADVPQHTTTSASVTYSETTDSLLSTDKVQEETPAASSETTIPADKVQEETPAASSGLNIPIVVAIVVAVCCVIVTVLVICFIKRRRQNKAKPDENHTKPDNDGFEITENAMYVPMEVRNRLQDEDRLLPNIQDGERLSAHTYDETSHSENTYDEADMDAIANNRNGQETKPLLQEHEPLVSDTREKENTFEEVTKSANGPDVSTEGGIADNGSNEKVVIIDKDKNASNIDIQGENEHIYDVSG